MPCYFFDIHDGSVIPDTEGQELPNVEAAIREAIASLPHIAAHEIPAGDDRRHFSIVVRDEAGRGVYTAALSFCGTRLPL